MLQNGILGPEVWTRSEVGTILKATAHRHNYRQKLQVTLQQKAVVFSPPAVYGFSFGSASKNGLGYC